MTRNLFRRRRSVTAPSLLFLHIAKTAGTSLRLELVEEIGSRHCHFDYGRVHHLTSRLVVRHAYEQPDFFELARQLGNAGGRLLGGHFSYRKYAALFRADHVLAFCRHPREQLLSHFAHLRRYGGFRGDMAEFLRTAHGAGYQTRVFSNFPINGIGLVGVTERFEESLRVLNASFGLNLKPGLHNVNPDRGDGNGGGYTVPESLRERFEAAVGQDLPLWERASELLDARIAALDAGHVWVHGGLQAVDRHTVLGFAWSTGDDSPVRLELLVNGEMRAELTASSDRPALRGWNVPRNGFVGFDHRDRDFASDGDEITVRVAGTGQLIDRRTIAPP